LIIFTSHITNRENYTDISEFQVSAHSARIAHIEHKDPKISYSKKRFFHIKND